MIKITVRKDYIKAEGHAGYGESGKDIVCSGVSTLLQTLELYSNVVKKEKGLIVLVPNDNNWSTYIDFVLNGLFLWAYKHPQNIEIEVIG